MTTSRLTATALAVVASLTSLVALPAAALAKPANGSYYGTARGCIGISCSELLVKVSSKGTKWSAQTRFETTCASEDPEFGGNWAWPDGVDTDKRKLKKGGRFAITGALDVKAPKEYGGPATKGTIHLALSGHFVSKKKAVATLKVRIVGKNAAGKQVDTCKSKDTFTLKR